MLRPRIIPVLLLRNNVLVKTIGFKNEKYIGDPINAVHIYNDLHADELVFLDITASSDARATMVDVVERTASECFMPLTVGGGIRSVGLATSTSAEYWDLPV